jgi:hypothetical protein
LPDKSGLPSGLRGVGASIATFPSASRGTPGAWYFGHWAPIDTEHIATMMAAPAIGRFMTISCASDH